MEACKTASTCTPEVAQGTHVFNILGYSKHRGMGNGPNSYIRSQTFTVGGHDWAIRCYPDGYFRQYKDYISVYLELLSKGAKVRASCDLRLVDQCTGISSSVHKTEPRIFNFDDVSTTFAPETRRFKKRNEIENSAFLRDDRLTIECIVTVMKTPHVAETRPFPKIDMPSSDMAEQVGRLLEGKEGFDVSFSVGGETFEAHKFVLAMRSPVFKAELYGLMMEARTAQSITVDDMQPAVFRALLHFIYTDSMPANHLENTEMIRLLLVAADRYAMERLKLVCQSILCEGLNAETVATTLALADQHSCDKLKGACFEFIETSVATTRQMEALVFHIVRLARAVAAILSPPAVTTRQMEACKTASTCTPEVAQGTHVFNILGYSKHRGMGNGPNSYIRSQTFTVGGHDWAIRCYPDGYFRQYKDYISVYLELLSKGAKVRASCDLRLVDQCTGISSSVHKTEPRIFNFDDVSTKFAPETPGFKKRNEIENSAFLRDDRLTIECIVTVMKTPHVAETRPFPKIDMPSSDMAEQVGRLLEGKEGFDVSFSVGGETFEAHKFVLAMRSPVFKAELYGPMMEARTAQSITVDDMQPAVFRALLHFIYTDSMPANHLENTEMIRLLLVAADRYAMERLKLVCQSILCEGLNAETVATTLALADQHSCDKLKGACFEFIETSVAMDAVVATQGFQDLMVTCSALAVEALEKRRKFRKA